MGCMHEVIPAILAKDKLEFEKKLDILEGQTEMAQIDIMDGKFVPGKTFQDPERASQTKLSFELHLMVEDPETVIDEWKSVSGVKRVIIHAEIKKPLEPILKKIKNLGWETGIAINPETPWQKIDELIHQVDTVLIMTVHPGKSGQVFEEAVLTKITELHQTHPGLVISIDGGVNENTLPHLIKTGATRFAAGSGIFRAPDPIAAFKRLELLLK